MLLAAPHNALPRAKRTRPESRIGRRPKMLAKCPESGRKATPASVYAEPIHTNCWPWKWFTIVGKAVDTALCDENGISDAVVVDTREGPRTVSSAARKVAIVMASIDSQNEAVLGVGAGAWPEVVSAMMQALLLIGY